MNVDTLLHTKGLNLSRRNSQEYDNDDVVSSPSATTQLIKACDHNVSISN